MIRQQARETNIGLAGRERQAFVPNRECKKSGCNVAEKVEYIVSEHRQGKRGFRAGCGVSLQQAQKNVPIFQDRLLKPRS